MKIALRYKFTGIVLLAALPFLIYGVTHYIATVNDNKTAVINKNQAIAEETAEKTERFIQSTQNILYSIATHPAVINHDPTKTDEIFGRLLPLYTHYENIIAADMNGTNIGSGLEQKTAHKLRYLEREWFKQSRNGVSYVSDYFISKLLEHPVFMVSMPVFDEYGRQNAVLGLATNLFKLQEYLIQIERVAANCGFCIIDNNGKILIDSQKRENIGTVYKPPSLLQRISKESSGSLTDFSQSGEDYFYSYATINSTGWKVIAGQPVKEVYAEANHAALQHLLIFFLTCSAGLIFSLVYSRKIGKKVELLIKGFNEISSGNLEYKVNIRGSDEFSCAASAFNRMINERKLAENEIKHLADSLEKRVNERTAELLSAKTELEAFAYTVSHDLQAPARHVIGYSDIISQNHLDELTEESRHHLLRIKKAGEKMRDMITHLLALSNLNQKKLTCINNNLSTLCRTIFTELEESSPERSVKILIQEELFIDADPVLLEIAIRNLMDNAWKFTAKTSAPLIEIGYTVKNDKNCYFVKDNGCGFNMQYSDKLFLPFHKLHSEKDYEGIGIGLATVYRIVHRHDGFIFAESVTNEGATFYFSMSQ
ncbi:MAG: GHKL domain-containing protein [Geobacteraceae bacterium]|nr:GHKL domain-containing protein [Geobacteraceae bacterium]